jgi:hypothetical protein
LLYIYSLIFTLLSKALYITTTILSVYFILGFLSFALGAFLVGFEAAAAAAAITASSAASAAASSAALVAAAMALADSFFFRFSGGGIDSAAGGASTSAEFEASSAGCAVGLVALN